MLRVNDAYVHYNVRRFSGFLIISNLIAFHTEFAAESIIFIKLVLFSHVLKLHLKVVGFFA